MGTNTNSLNTGFTVAGFPIAGFPLGLVGFSLIVAFYKAVTLSLEMTGTLAVMAKLLSLDLAFLGLVCLLSVLHLRSATHWMRISHRILLAALVAFYTIHSFVLLALDEYMNLFDLARFFQEWQVVLSFFDALTISVTLVFVLAVFINYRTSKRPPTGLVVALILVVLAGLTVVSSVPYQLQKYAVLQPGSLIAQVSAKRGISSYTRDQLEFYASARLGAVEFSDDDPNIILLIVESLSSINSYKVSGELKLLSQFDELAEDGILFTNFFANHSASEGGIISLLSGFPPLHYPGATPLMFDEFAIQPSVMGEYRQRGYFTEFLTNADLGFIGMDRYISGLKFDRARGRDEVPELARAPRQVQNAPSDRYLYAVALETVGQLDKQQGESGRPWIMTIATVSTHLPYTHPEGGEDTPRAVWDWSLRQLRVFYQGLQAQGFFHNGILLISGDHRQMRPLSNRETSRYGDSAKARIPLLAIGKEFSAGTLDERFFQQSDLLRMLNRIGQSNRELSPHPVWVERYNRIYGKVDSINRFSVFDQADQGMREIPARMTGIELSWTDKRPSFFRNIEAKVHAQRSAHQFIRNGDNRACSPLYEAWDEIASQNQGLALSVVQTGDLDNFAGLMPGADETYSSNAIARPLVMPFEGDQVLWFRTYLELEQGGLYWFRMAPGNLACLGINQQLVVDQISPGIGTQGSIELEAGLHALDIRFLVKAGSGSGPAERVQAAGLSLQWVPPGLTRWRWSDVPRQQFRMPAPIQLIDYEYDS